MAKPRFEYKCFLYRHIRCGIAFCSCLLIPCTSTYYQKNRIRYKYFTIVYIKHNFYSFSLHILFDAIYWQQVLSSKPRDWALKITWSRTRKPKFLSKCNCCHCQIVNNYMITVSQLMEDDTVQI